MNVLSAGAADADTAARTALNVQHALRHSYNLMGGLTALSSAGIGRPDELRDNVAGAPHAVRHKSCCRAIKRRATKRSIAFLLAAAGPFDTLGFSQCSARAFDRGQRMLELWNNWYETLASVEALATVVVFVVVGTAAIMLVQGRRR
jgi:hypothetical protein